MLNSAVADWLESLEQRHLANLKFSEVSRALRALSSAYVERRGRIAEGAALSGAGKRAAFALFYGPIHFFLTQHIVAARIRAGYGPSVLVDLGCGTGAAGAAWASTDASVRRVLAFDRNEWATHEARLTYRNFGLQATVNQRDVVTAPLPKERAALIAAYTINELSDQSRDIMMTRLLDRAYQGDRVLVVEPIARSVTPWWGRWRDAFVAAGGREDEWRIRVELPPIVAKLDRAAGLDHRELTGRSLWSG